MSLGDIQLRFVGDVADGAGLGARTEQRSLRTLQDLDAIQVRRIDVEISIRSWPDWLSR